MTWAARAGPPARDNAAQSAPASATRPPPAALVYAPPPPQDMEKPPGPSAPTLWVRWVSGATSILLTLGRRQVARGWALWGGVEPFAFRMRVISFQLPDRAPRPWPAPSEWAAAVRYGPPVLKI